MDAKFRDVPDALWELVEPHLPVMGPYPRGGRPPTPNRVILAGVLYKMRTGCQWKAIPSVFGSGPTCHRRFSHWVELGAFPRIWEAALRFYDELKGLDWKWASLDSATVKAPKGGTRQVRTPRIARSLDAKGTSSRTERAFRSA